MVAVPFKDPWKNPPRVIDPSPLHLLCRSAPKNPERSEPCDVAPAFLCQDIQKNLKLGSKVILKVWICYHHVQYLQPPPSLMLQIILVHQTLKERSTKWPFCSHCCHPATSQQPLQLLVMTSLSKWQTPHPSSPRKEHQNSHHSAGKENQKQDSDAP